MQKNEQERKASNIMVNNNDLESHFGVSSGFTHEVEEKGWAQTFGPFTNEYMKMMRRIGFVPETLGNHPLDIALIGASLYSITEFATFSQSLGPNTRATIVDIRDVSRHLKNSSVRFIQADAQNMRKGISDSSFDIVFTHWLTHHLPDKVAFAEELYRTLNSDGSIALIELERDENFLTALENSGFVDIDVQNVEGLSMQEYLRISNNTPTLNDYRVGSNIRFQAVAISARKQHS